jgi:hypothetical protein
MFLYVPEFLTSSDRQHLLDELSKLQFNDENNQMAPGRLRTYIVPGTNTHRIFTSPEVLRYMSYVFGEQLTSGAHILPIEYRKYPIGAKGMLWHRDSCMIGNQYECVYTLTNTSDSETLYKDFFGRVHRVWAEPNSLIVVRAGGVEHAVTPVTKGERTILKFVCIKASSE